MAEGQPELRERTRRAVRTEITDAANALFSERGYDATTIDEIAAAANMSKRSVFRYFPTKEDIVVGKFDAVADAMLAELRARPAEEPVWVSLRRAFDLLMPYVDGPGRHDVAERMQQVVFETPGLFARYLEKLQLMESAAEIAVRERQAETGRPFATHDPAPRAVIGSAFGCLLAAQHAWLADDAGRTFADTVDRAMAAMAPQAGWSQN